MQLTESYTILLINRSPLESIQEIQSAADPERYRWIPGDKDPCNQVKRLAEGELELPHMIILDLELRNGCGYKILEDIKTNEQLAHIPVIVYGQSATIKDIERAYALNANCYIQKSFTSEVWASSIYNLLSYWHNHSN